MPVSVTPIEISRKFIVKAPLTKAFAVLSDVPESAAHFPKVEALTPLGRGRLRMENEKTALTNTPSDCLRQHLSGR